MRLYVMRHCERNLDNCSFESPLLPNGHYNAKNLFGNMNKKKNRCHLFITIFKNDSNSRFL